MNIEEFKLILEVARDAGDGAKTIAIFYIVMPLVKSLFGIAAWLTTLTILVRAAKSIVDRWCNYARAWRAVCNLVGANRGEDSDPYSGDVDRIIAKIKNYKNK